MKKVLIAITTVSVLAASCGSAKKYNDLKNQQTDLQTKLSNAEKDLAASKINLSKSENQVASLEDKIKFLERGNEKLLQNVDNLIVISQAGTNNMKSTLDQLGKKDEYIKQLRNLQTKKDSINLAVAFNLKKVLPNGLNDEDISVNVEGTKVFISIADRLLFNSGSYQISRAAEGILKKVGQIINEYPTMDVMVEGHTDGVDVIQGSNVKDNWDLSVERSTAVVRELQSKYNVHPTRLIAAGRGEYAPLKDNNTPANRAANRRTKIIIMPKLDEFFDLLKAKE